MGLLLSEPLSRGQSSSLNSCFGRHTPTEAQTAGDVRQTLNNSGPQSAPLLPHPRPRPAPSLCVSSSVDLGGFVHIYGFESGNYLYWFRWSVWYKFTFCLPAPKLNASKSPLPNSQVHGPFSWPCGLRDCAGKAMLGRYVHCGHFNF